MAQTALSNAKTKMAHKRLKWLTRSASGSEIRGGQVYTLDG